MGSTAAVVVVDDVDTPRDLRLRLSCGPGGSPDGNSLATMSADHTTKIWNLNDFTCEKILTGAQHVYSLACPRDTVDTH